MLTALLVVIFISFISVGLPDSVLGPAWPAMYKEFDLPLSLAGYITATVSAGTIISSLLSARLINRFGTGNVVAVSTLFTAVALMGYAFTKSPVFFFILALPLGLGAGSVDTALNNFVALHYSAAQTSFLHCFYGIGVTASPFIMSLALGDGSNWRSGYFVIASIQLAIAAISFLALPLWHKIQKKDKEIGTPAPKALSLLQLIKTPGVFVSAFCFFSICALELSAGAWCSSYFVNVKGIPASAAASITMLMYIGLVTGRFLSGLLAGSLGRRRLLRLSFYLLFFVVIVFMLPLPTVVSATALFFLGFALGPVYPNLVHLTPDTFGGDISQSVMGLQQAMTYLGIMVMPWLFGVLADLATIALLPYYLLAMFALYAVAFIMFMKEVRQCPTRLILK